MTDPPQTPILPLNKILVGNCVPVMEALPEKSIDLVFADPPYNLQLSQELWRPNQTRVDGVEDAWDHFDSFAAYDEFTRRWLAGCRRVLKDTGTLWVIGAYHNIYRVGTALLDLGFWILNDIIWVKTNPMPNFHGVRFTNAHETLIWAQKKKGARYTFNHHPMKALNDDLQMRSDWEIPLCTGKERMRVNGIKAHATQKPEALLYRVILSSTNPGDIVLDPFMGSGTSGAVAKKLHRNWIGIEQDPNYARLAGERIEQVQPVPYTAELFEFPGRRSQPRVPFGRLLESGLLSAGQRLFFGKAAPKNTGSQLTAIILADGSIRCGAITGSIHKVGRELLQAPCNGWDQWYYQDAVTGEKYPIDHLRKQYLAAQSARPIE